MREWRETSAGFRRVLYHACPRVSLTTSDVFVMCVHSGGGQGGGSPGEQGAGGVRETGEERAGGGISTMAGSGREIQKGKLLVFVTAYFQSKKGTEERFLTSI